MSKLEGSGHQERLLRLQQGFRGVNFHRGRKRFSFRALYWRLRAFSGLFVLAAFAVPAFLVASPGHGALDRAPAGPYYANCDAARAAGVAPILAGHPGYRAWLDADNDGVACEPFGW